MPATGTTATTQAEPLADLQWDMKMIHATADGSYKKEKGSKRVLVGILDTGVDGNHPDIAPNFDKSAEPELHDRHPGLVDGPCADEPDALVQRPERRRRELATARTSRAPSASPINGIGMAGVAPNVTLVNLRAGQDSGFFFLQPSVDALTYAGDHGIDVVNMSYFIDPWLYNCGNPLDPVPEDSPTQQAEQKTIIEATQRALDYAHQRGVTLVAAARERAHRHRHADVRRAEPELPAGHRHDRTVNNSCLDLPTEGNNVISVSSIGPSKTKSDFSNWGYERDRRSRLRAAGSATRAGPPQTRRRRRGTRSSPRIRRTSPRRPAT